MENYKYPWKSIHFIVCAYKTRKIFHLESLVNCHTNNNINGFIEYRWLATVHNRLNYSLMKSVGYGQGAWSYDPGLVCWVMMWGRVEGNS